MVFLAAKSEEGAGLVASGETFFGNCCFAGSQSGDFFLVLVESVALDFHVEDGSAVGFSIELHMHVGRLCWDLPVLRRDLMRARCVAHRDIMLQKNKRATA